MHVGAARISLECMSKTCRDHAHFILHTASAVPRIFLTAPHAAPALGLHYGQSEQGLHSGKLATSSF